MRGFPENIRGGEGLAPRGEGVLAGPRQPAGGALLRGGGGLGLVSEAWKTERGWLQSPLSRVKVQHSGPGSRKPIPHVLSQGELPASQPGHSQ